MSTLAPRGAELADGPSLRELFGGILGDKYDKETNPNGMINIGTAENYTMIPEVSQYTQAHPVALTPNQLSYGEGPWGTPRLRHAMAHHMNKRFHPVIPIQPDDLLFANGVSTICELLGFSLFFPSTFPSSLAEATEATAGNQPLKSTQRKNPAFAPLKNGTPFSSNTLPATSLPSANFLLERSKNPSNHSSSSSRLQASNSEATGIHENCDMALIARQSGRLRV
ncbi:hypothetical protein KC341_g16840 [Hortaea werneckii]|nr:hypothetical protein KC341_g16840 [Hortaea werneckii]